MPITMTKALSVISTLKTMVTVCKTRLLLVLLLLLRLRLLQKKMSAWGEVLSAMAAWVPPIRLCCSAKVQPDINPICGHHFSLLEFSFFWSSCASVCLWPAPFSSHFQVILGWIAQFPDRTLSAHLMTLSSKKWVALTLTIWRYVICSALNSLVKWTSELRSRSLVLS